MPEMPSNLENNNKRKAGTEAAYSNKKHKKTDSEPTSTPTDELQVENQVVDAVVSPGVDDSLEPTDDSESDLETRRQLISDRRTRATSNLHATANRMAIQHIRWLGEAKVGDTVQDELSKFDKGPLDCAFLLAYITEIDKVRSLYKLCTTKGMIKGLQEMHLQFTSKTSLNMIL